jgi:hypothetical protein
MVKTFRKSAGLEKLTECSEQLCCPAAGYLADLPANVCSWRDTRLLVMLRLGATLRHAGWL